MIIRKAALEDQPGIKLAGSVGFEGAYDPTAEVDWEKWREGCDERPVSRGEAAWRDRWAAFDEESGDLMGSIHCIEYPVRWGGGIVKMSGIGGVATLPQYRRRGVVKACFAAAFREMRERGQIISTLYPFSDAFYRQFGYENCVRAKRWRVPLRALRTSGVKGKVEMFRVGGDYRPYDEVYRAMSERFDLACVREEIDWARFARQNPAKERMYTYLWRNADGAPKAYITFTKEHRESRRYLDAIEGFGDIRGFAFADAEGLTGILDFIKTFEADYDIFECVLPYALDIEAFVHMNNDLSVDELLRTPLRVVDVEKALWTTDYRGSGTVRIAVEDEMCPWNTGMWRLEYADGRATDVRRTEEPPDVKAPASEMGRLLFGALDADELWLAPKVRVANAKALGGVVFRRRTWVTESF